MGLTRVELVTSSLSGTRSNQLSYKPVFSFELRVSGGFKLQAPSSGLEAGVGGGSRIRTGDILLAKQALYQLSHAPSGAAQPSGREAEHISQEPVRSFQLAPRGAFSSERR